MNNILVFPQKEKLPKPLPRQRVFYLGYRYSGPPLCQDLQHVYLKRNGLVNGKRKWSLITYAKYDEWDRREHSIELVNCEENDLPDILNEWDMSNNINFEELRSMGWNGKVLFSAKVINLFDA